MRFTDGLGRIAKLTTTYGPGATPHPGYTLGFLSISSLVYSDLTSAVEGPLDWQRAAVNDYCRRRVRCDVPRGFSPFSTLMNIQILAEGTPNLDWFFVLPSLRDLPVPAQYKWPSNVWVGVLVEDQVAADERIPQLMRTRAKKKFLLMNPLRGMVDITNARGLYDHPTATGSHTSHGSSYIGVDLVVVGGQDGAQARPIHPAWPASIFDQCGAAGVSFLFEGWGAWHPVGELLRPEGWDGQEERVRLTVCGCNSSSDLPWCGVPGLGSSGHECDASEDLWMERMASTPAQEPATSGAIVLREPAPAPSRPPDSVEPPTGPPARPPARPPFRIAQGSPWPGLGKLVEEAAEVTQVAARLIGAPNAAPHLAEAVLRGRLEEELGDLMAAAAFVAEANGLDERKIAARRAEKLSLFTRWHDKG